MELEAAGVSSGKTIETDVCIVGAGPAGGVLAAALSADAARDVVVLESGDARGGATAQRLDEGEVVGDAYAGLKETRHRGVGGTSLIWNTPVQGQDGAKYVPLDPWDLEPRWPEAPDGWPFAFGELAPWYAAAEAICGLDGEGWDAGAWESPGSCAPAVGDGVATRVYRFGTRERLLARSTGLVRQSASARLVTGATVVAIAADPAGATLTVARDDGERFLVRARRVVLAAGAVENARLLLVAALADGGIADRSGWLGRGFMEHPRDRALSLTLARGASCRALAFHDLHAVGDAIVAGRLGLDGEVARRDGLLNASATFLPRAVPWRRRLRERLGPLAWRLPVDRWLPAARTGWSARRDADRVFDGFHVLLNLEQPPRRGNAIVLGNRRDAFGTPLPVLHWRWHPDDQARLQRVRATFARAIEEMGLGRVEVDERAIPDPNAHHHAGTTRMHRDPAHGVTDEHGRVHGTSSVYVAGASLFPSAGFANPMLTIVALSLRLAEHLRREG